MARFLNIGLENCVNVDKIISIVNADSNHAKKSRTCVVPMPMAMEPKAPCVAVWELPRGIPRHG